MQLLDQMFDRCNQTVAATSHLLRCWIHTSTLEGYWPKPFKLPKLKTQQKYRAFWKQFICFAFRVWATDSTSGLQCKVYGKIQFSQLQQSVMSDIWAYIDSPDSSAKSENGLEMDPKVDLEYNPECSSGSEYDSGSGLESGLESGSDSDSDSEIGSEIGPECGLEHNPESDPEIRSEIEPEIGPSENPARDLLFQLSCLFWMEGSAAGNTAQLPLVYFLGVLGIHRNSLAYRTAYHYTPFLAGLIWIGRLLLLEYALPKQPYLALRLLAAAGYKDQLRRLQHIRRTCLCQGSACAMSYLLDTVRLGRSIAGKEGPRTNISWSLDKQTLDLDKQLISMYSFRSMVWVAIQEAQIALRQLMFNWEPEIGLNAIQDSLINNRPGWSFVSEPTNGLQNSFRHLQRQAWHDRPGGLMAVGCHPEQRDT